MTSLKVYGVDFPSYHALPRYSNLNLSPKRVEVVQALSSPCRLRNQWQKQIGLVIGGKSLKFVQWILIHCVNSSHRFFLITCRSVAHRQDRSLLYEIIKRKKVDFFSTPACLDITYVFVRVALRLDNWWLHRACCRWYLSCSCGGI